METEEKQQTIAEFAAKHQITIAATFLGKRDEPSKKKGEKGWAHFLWHCTLKRPGAVMDQEFKMGVGHITLTRPLPKGIRPNTLAHEDHYKQYGTPTPPKAEDILNSLIMDSSALDESFENWCAELGYDSDSREAERIYHACKTEGAKLKSFLGAELFSELKNCEQL